MTVDALAHMEEAWSLDANPFPAEAIHAQDSPYCPTVFDEESQEFRRKLIRGSVRGSVNIGFLWSQGAHADTGFGKTTLMREITKEINHDLGAGNPHEGGHPRRQASPHSGRFLQSKHPQCVRAVPRALQRSHRPHAADAGGHSRARPGQDAYRARPWQC